MDPTMDLVVLLVNLMIDLILVQSLMDLTIFWHFDGFGFGAFGDRSDDFV